ncbi:MAG: HAD-IIB family hydrolase [Gammaproteobacteria bacterium]|nr:HAD-IIB family hydrolase [Gammaproteobacteria bacterium]
MTEPITKKNEPEIRKRLLLCTDLDRTLIPNGDQPESEHARDYFRRLSEHHQVTLVYVTGRHQQLVEQAVADYGLPQADFVIGDVGSSLYRITNNHWQYQADWHEIISHDWQGKNISELQSYLADIEALELQEASKQNTHKLSYYISLDSDHQTLIATIKQRLQQHAIASSLIWSIDRLANIGLLDILPASAGKCQAIEFLMKKLDYHHSETVFAGDSGNDICVLSSSVPAVLVANADAEVRQQAVKVAKLKHHQSCLYLARGDFMGMNGNYSAGIVEGVIHYMPHLKDWLRGAA